MACTWSGESSSCSIQWHGKLLAIGRYSDTQSLRQPYMLQIKRMRMKMVVPSKMRAHLTGQLHDLHLLEAHELGAPYLHLQRGGAAGWAAILWQALQRREVLACRHAATPAAHHHIWQSKRLSLAGAREMQEQCRIERCCTATSCERHEAGACMPGVLQHLAGAGMCAWTTMESPVTSWYTSFAVSSSR